MQGRGIKLNGKAKAKVQDLAINSKDIYPNDIKVVYVCEHRAVSINQISIQGISSSSTLLLYQVKRESIR